MQDQKGFALRPAIAALALAASSIALAPASNAAPEDACLRGPKGVAPQGKHWYYRTERPSMRKCWYLAEKGRAVAQRSASRAAARAEPDDDEADTPATVASVPAAPVANAPGAATASAAPVASAPAVPATEPMPVITTLTTRTVSNPPTEITQAAAAPDATQPPPAADAASSTTPIAEAAPAPAVSTLAERFPSDPPAPAHVVEQPATAAAARELAGAADEPMSALQLLLGAIALTGFLASGVFLAVALRRRRNDVLEQRRETDALPYEPAPEMASEEEGPRFEPLRALDPIRQRDLDPMRQHDDVDEILHRLARRRRAA